jgi:2-pyrone-4,6-dicarboxylate lactonase
MQTEPVFLPPNLDPRPPAAPLPPNACDSHAHVFGPADRFPFDVSRTYTPAEATIADYLHVCATVGIQRAVLVQPSVYADDHRLLLHALGAAPDMLRGVAVVRADVQDDELATLHDAGVRGVRVNPRSAEAATLADLPKLALRIESMGWHVQVITDGDSLPLQAAQLAALPVPVVIDHMGSQPVHDGLGHPGVQALLGLLRDAGAWVKLSAPYLISPHRPRHDDTVALMRVLHAAAPDRTVWGSNWPHPGLSAPAPEEGDLLDLLAQAIPDEDARKQVLVGNPSRLYHFATDDVAARMTER